MQIITEPTVTVISAPQFYHHPTYQIPSDGEPATMIGAFAARGCYDSFNSRGRSSNTENQQNVIAHGHGSVLEHITFGVFIEGITRACSLEVVRHRAGFAYSQRSTRYVAEEEGAIVLEPFFADLWVRNRDEFWEEQGRFFTSQAASAETKLLVDHLNAQIDAGVWYGDQVMGLVKLNPYDLTGFDLRKWARGKARNLLPNGMETRLTMTGNLRAWRHFVTLRSEPHAEDEIRRLAGHVYDALSPLAPLYFEDFQIQLVRGLRTFVPRHHKV